MTRTMLQAILAMLLLASGASGALAAPLAPSPRWAAVAPAPERAALLLSQRLEQWPHWRLPAPLPRPGQADLAYPDWFAGLWQVTSRELPPPATPLVYSVRFQPAADGALVGDRAFNASAIGRALLGDGLRSVRNDPGNPNRQLAELAADRRLESTVVGRLSGSDASAAFLSDELSLQVLHGPGEPRISRIEVLSRWRWHPGGQDGRGWIEAEQWQAGYPSPAEGLRAPAVSVSHRLLRLEPQSPAADPAS